MFVRLEKFNRFSLPRNPLHFCHSSQTYQLTKNLNGSKEAPLADPEPTSDISNQLITSNYPNATNGSAHKTTPPSSLAALEPLISESNAGTATVRPRAAAGLMHPTSTGDSMSESPLTGAPPCDLPAVGDQKMQLPESLRSLHGEAGRNRRIERDRKIVLYVLAADDAGGHRAERAILRALCVGLRQTYAARGFELLFCDTVVTDPDTTVVDRLNASRWSSNGPLEARGGHETVAPCLAEIASMCDFNSHNGQFLEINYFPHNRTQ